MSKKHWVPLESNPEVLTKFARALGLPDPWAFCDVWSPDPDTLAFIPAPRLAVLCLYPLTPSILAADAARAAAAAASPPPPAGAAAPYFVKQKIGNACGTIALVHAALNAARGGGLALRAGSFFDGFLARTAALDADARADALGDDGALDGAHAEFAAQGQTAAPAAEEAVELHFVAFVCAGGVLWELDGRKAAAVPHGACADGALLPDACRVIQDKFMAADPGEHRFTLLALAPGAGGGG